MVDPEKKTESRSRHEWGPGSEANASPEMKFSGKDIDLTVWLGTEAPSTDLPLCASVPAVKTGIATVRRANVF